MALHIVKLCYGWDSVDALEARISERAAHARSAGAVEEMGVQTRMEPKRASELLAGGSLYWIIKSQIVARQELLDIRPHLDGAGVKRCFIVVKPTLVRTTPRPRKPFQGWRYLEAADAPPDLSSADAEMPEGMRKELASLGLL
ncbi:hypothetical protein ACVIGB_000429 [Bradyrhizobium sp. USDA 4341]